MSDTEYNGWKNYPTWNVKLWIDNDEGLQNAVLEMARAAEGDVSVLERGLEDLLDEMEETFPQGDSVGPHSDLLTWAVGMVDWRTIAKRYLEEVEDEDDEAA